MFAPVNGFVYRFELSAGGTLVLRFDGFRPGWKQVWFNVETKQFQSHLPPYLSVELLRSR